MLKLSQTEMSPSRIDPAPNNPNVMEPERYAALVEAIRRFGFLQPVLVRPHPDDARRFIACDGHHRVRAAMEVGLASIPVVVAGNITQEEADALQIAMNRLRGELDLSATATILDSLRAAGWGASDLGVLGFSLEEVSDLLASLDSDPDILPESIESPDDPATPAGFVMEIEFDSAEQMRVVKRALRRAAGKGRPLSHGLLKLLAEE